MKAIAHHNSRPLNGLVGIVGVRQLERGHVAVDDNRTLGKVGQLYLSHRLTGIKAPVLSMVRRQRVPFGEIRISPTVAGPRLMSVFFLRLFRSSLTIRERVSCSFFCS